LGFRFGVRVWGKELQVTIQGLEVWSEGLPDMPIVAIVFMSDDLGLGVTG